jgi:hypothetical protein
MTFQSGISSFGSFHRDSDRMERSRSRFDFVAVRFMQLGAVAFCLLCWAGVFCVAANVLKAVPHAHQVAQTEQVASIATGS